jgi:hypothetical protein
MMMADYLDEYALATEINNVEGFEPQSLKEAKSRADWPFWQEAMKEELVTLKAAGTWELVDPPENANIVGSKWVFRIKKDAAGNIVRYKARLVLKNASLFRGHGNRADSPKELDEALLNYKEARLDSCQRRLKERGITAIEPVDVACACWESKKDQMGSSPGAPISTKILLLLSTSMKYPRNYHAINDLLLFLDRTTSLLQLVKQVTTHATHNPFNGIPKLIIDTILLGFQILLHITFFIRRSR